jgi:hypothetical protein
MPKRLADEIAVVKEVVVSERGALGRSGRTTGELDVDRVVELQLGLQLGQHPAMLLPAHAEHVIEADIARRLATADADQGRERRHAPGAHLPGGSALDLGHQLAQHAEIVAGLEALGGDQRLASNLVERVLELVGPIRGVDVDQDETGLGRRELGDHPLGVVRRPDADAVARRQAERQEPGGERVHPLL